MSCDPEDKNPPQAENPNEAEPTQGHASDPAEEAVDWQNPQTWPKEVGGSQGPEPTRYGDWENNGRCTDF